MKRTILFVGGKTPQILTWFIVQSISVIFLLVIRQLGIGNSLLFEQVFVASFMGPVCLLFIYKISPRFQGLKQIAPCEIGYLLIIAVLSFQLIVPSSILNIDRSRSFYVLSWVKDGNVHIKDNGLVLTGVKSHEALDVDAIDSRLNEQISRGLINKLNGDYELTLRGSLMVKIADILSILFKLQGWNENKH